MLKKIILVLISSVFSLLMVEVFARYFVHPNYTKMEYQYQVDEKLIYRHQPNFKGEWKTKEFIEITELNSNGFRNPENSPSKEKILFLGDSMVFGHGVDYEKTFAHLVANQFTDRELINAAVKGYGIDQSFILFNEILEKEKVTHVFLGIHLNDVYDSFVKSRFFYDGRKLVSVSNQDTLYAKLFIEYYSNFHKYLRSRALQYLFSKYLEKKVSEESAIVFNEREQKLKIVQIIKEMVKKTQSLNIQIKFILMPIFEQSEVDYSWLTSKSEMKYFILPEGFLNTDFLSDRIHLNEAGHEKMKNLILGNLKLNSNPEKETILLE